MEAESEQMQASIKTVFFFSQRVVKPWNRLPASVVEASSINSFKKRVDDWNDVELSSANIHNHYKLQVQVYTADTDWSYLATLASFPIYKAWHRGLNHSILSTIIINIS